MLEVAARQTNDNRETPSDILEHVSVLYKYSVHNGYVVQRWEGTKHTLFIQLAHTNLNAIIMADVQSVHSDLPTCHNTQVQHANLGTDRPDWCH